MKLDAFVNNNVKRSLRSPDSFMLFMIQHDIANSRITTRSSAMIITDQNTKSSDINSA